MACHVVHSDQRRSTTPDAPPRRSVLRPCFGHCARGGGVASRMFPCACLLMEQLANPRRTLCLLGTFPAWGPRRRRRRLVSSIISGGRHVRGRLPGAIEGPVEVRDLGRISQKMLETQQSRLRCRQEQYSCPRTSPALGLFVCKGHLSMQYLGVSKRMITLASSLAKKSNNTRIQEAHAIIEGVQTLTACRMSLHRALPATREGIH